MLKASWKTKCVSEITFFRRTQSVFTERLFRSYNRDERGYPPARRHPVYQRGVAGPTESLVQPPSTLECFLYDPKKRVVTLVRKNRSVVPYPSSRPLKLSGPRHAHTPTQAGERDPGVYLIYPCCSPSSRRRGQTHRRATTTFPLLRQENRDGGATHVGRSMDRANTRVEQIQMTSAHNLFVGDHWVTS